jgi:hypothetical protein
MYIKVAAIAFVFKVALEVPLLIGFPFLSTVTAFDAK